MYCVKNCKENPPPWLQHPCYLREDVLCKHAEDLENISDSAMFANLTDAVREGINSCEYVVQFLSASAAGGGIKYGRESSQAVDSQTSHVSGARS